MKKSILLVALLITALFAQAQRCVLLDFQIGDDVTEEEVDAVSYEFRANFLPTCYNVEDYFRVAKILNDFGYNPSAMTKDQIRKFGRKMTATVVVYGSLSKLMDEYSLDVNVLDVSTGNTLFTKNTTFQKSEYRTKPRLVAKEVSSQLCKSSSGTLAGESSTGSGTVATTTTSKSTVPEGYTDLGLPSGTLWKNYDEKPCSYDDAIRRYGDRLPTKTQWEELIDKCKWEKCGKYNFKLTGPNGNSILLYIVSHSKFDAITSLHKSSVKFYYWSSTPESRKMAWLLYWEKYNNCARMRKEEIDKRCSVRLIKN